MTAKQEDLKCSLSYNGTCYYIGSDKKTKCPYGGNIIDVKWPDTCKPCKDSSRLSGDDNRNNQAFCKTDDSGVNTGGCYFVDKQANNTKCDVPKNSSCPKSCLPPHQKIIYAILYMDVYTRTLLAGKGKYRTVEECQERMRSWQKERYKYFNNSHLIIQM